VFTRAADPRASISALTASSEANAGVRSGRSGEALELGPGLRTTDHRSHRYINTNKLHIIYVCL